MSKANRCAFDTGPSDAIAGDENRLHVGEVRRGADQLGTDLRYLVQPRSARRCLVAEYGAPVTPTNGQRRLIREADKRADGRCREFGSQGCPPAARILDPVQARCEFAAGFPQEEIGFLDDRCSNFPVSPRGDGVRQQGFHRRNLPRRVADQVGGAGHVAYEALH